MIVLSSERLRLVAVDRQLARLERDPEALARALGCELAEGWPPPLVAESLGCWSEELARDPGLEGWTSWLWLRRGAHERLIGYGGFKGMPDAHGVVELGYALCSAEQRRGYGAEAVTALARWAFSSGRVRRIDAETLPELAASITLLSRVGFRPLPSTDPEVLRFGLARERWGAL